jgi:hypothetical protein
MRKELVPVVVALATGGLVGYMVGTGNRRRSGTGGSLRGNTVTGVFHRPSCRYYDSPNNTAQFGSVSQARAAGFEPCQVCDG